MTPSCWSGAGWPEADRAKLPYVRPIGRAGVPGRVEINKVDAMRGLKVFGCASALALLVAATGASAQEGEGVKSLLGAIGIIPKEKPPINYSERAPLVLPPKMELRAPAAPRSAENQAPIGQRIRTSLPPARQRPRPELQRPAPKSIVPTVRAFYRPKRCAPAAILTITSSRLRP